MVDAGPLVRIHDGMEEKVVNTGRAVVGMGFVGIGVLLLLDQQDVVDAGRVVGDWWPVLVLVAAALDLSARPPRRTSAIVLGTLGVVLLAITTGVVDASVWQVVWPLALVGAGLWLLLRRPVRSRGTATADEDIDVLALFSSRRVVCTTPRFRGGSATALFGGVEIDLTGATIDGEAVLEATALFGGIEVEVPLGWRVVLDGPAILGGSENRVPTPSSDDAPTLRVRGTAILGGIDVKLGQVVAAPPPVPTAVS